MSDRIFQAIDEVAPQGLEAMLREVVRVGSDEHDYSKVWQAQYHLKRLELGLPESAESSEAFESKKDSWQQLSEARNQFRAEAAEHYKADRNFAEAASNFLEAGRHKDAIDMYVQEGSDKSLDSAAFWAVHSGVDYKFGFDLRIQKGELQRAFDDLQRVRFSDDFGMEERQQWGEYLTRAVYSAVVEGIKAEIEKQEGQKPKGETIPQLLEGKDDMHISVYDGNIDRDFRNSSMYVSFSSDPEIIQMGIELNAFQARNDRDEHKKEWYERTEMYLKGKLTGSEDCIQYLIKKAEESQLSDKSGFGKYDAERAVEVLEHHKKYNAALEVAERFLSPQRKTRFELLKKLGDTQKLATAHREVDNPIEYAIAVAGRNVQ